MTRIISTSFAVGMLLAWSGGSVAQSVPPPADARAGAAGQAIRFFFIADVHSRHDRLARFVEAVEREQPDLVIEGGDFVHDGTEAEFRRACSARAAVDIPWQIAPGNHDTTFRGPFSAPPPALPDFEVVEQGGIRFILLDNADQRFTEEQLQRLEAELAARPGRSTVVVMHVPVFLSREPTSLRLRRVLPFPLASPVVRDRAQVERFTALVERHGVLAVLAGHAHFPDRAVRGGVHYIVAGAAGGLTPGLGIAHEYLDITIEGRDLEVRRVPLGDPPRDPVSFILNAFRFYADLNRYIHAEQGWNHAPSASVQFRSGIERIRTGAGGSTVLFGAASFERVLGQVGRESFVADIGLLAGSRDLASQLAVGYRFRPVGSFNRNLYVGGAATANAGVVSAAATAGVGAQVGIGFEWHSLTSEVRWTRATNQRATSLTIGHRF